MAISGQTLWKGEQGSRVVLWKEQGIGDIFLSLAPEVQEICSSLSVYVDPRLQPCVGVLCQK